MSDRSEHLTPEVFVDFLDAAPVEASHRQHLAGCEHCRAELDELRGTLSLLTPSETARSEAGGRKRPWLPWVAAAAAALVATAAVYRGFDVSEPAAPQAVAFEEILPPLERDAEFQLLLVWTDALGEEWYSEEVSAFESEIGLDPGDWTAGERCRFVEKLTEELRSSSS